MTLKTATAIAALGLVIYEVYLVYTLFSDYTAMKATSPEPTVLAAQFWSSVKWTGAAMVRDGGLIVFLVTLYRKQATT
jgi:hypothetical protein